MGQEPLTPGSVQTPFGELPEAYTITDPRQVRQNGTVVELTPLWAQPQLYFTTWSIEQLLPLIQRWQPPHHATYDTTSEGGHFISMSADLSPPRHPKNAACVRLFHVKPACKRV